MLLLKNLALLLFLAITACNSSNQNNEQVSETDKNENQATLISESQETDWKKKDGLFAEMTTSKGSIFIELFYKRAPMTVANFVGLAEGTISNNAKEAGVPYYDGLKFHRVVPNFVIQGGDPLGNGTGGPGYKFGDEFHPDLKHAGPGILSMANSGPSTNGSQFFITHTATPHLDNKHSVFGKVVEGMDVVNAIEQGDDIVSLKIMRKGSDAKKFKADDDAFKSLQAGAAEKMAEVKAAEQEAMKAAQLELTEMDAWVKKNYPKAKKTESGLFYIVEKEGTGKPAEAGKTVQVHYTGKLITGKKFDSSYDRNQPIGFPLGQGRVIPGWDEGIAMMKEGGKMKLIIPYTLAYGERGFGDIIPPKAPLVFDTELVSVAE
ncbi:MAG: peptidylprolyl isomerase [Chitinophagales bacterium]|nr:peptidylprolyl isomerase [Chitinophagales bacterium]